LFVFVLFEKVLCLSDCDHRDLHTIFSEIYIIVHNVRRTQGIS